MATATFTGSLGATFTAGVGTVSPPATNAVATEPIIGVVSAHARLTLAIQPAGPPALQRVPMKGLSHTMPSPVMVDGRPTLPAIVAKVLPTARLIVGVGHIDGSSVPSRPGSPAGSHGSFWDVRDLPDPAGFSGGQYLLGTPSASDGTASIAAGAQQWGPRPDSDLQVSWKSAYPFKPMVAPHVHYGPRGGIVTHSAGIHFTPGHVEHMWADFGSGLTSTYTMLIACIVTDFAGRSANNHIFAAGVAPAGLTTAQRDSIYAHGLSGDIKLPAERFAYSNQLVAQRISLKMANDLGATTKMVRVPFTHTIKPKVMAMVVNGANSLLYVRDTASRHLKRQQLNTHTDQSKWVLGRGNGVLSPFGGCSMVVFEIRTWDAPLTETQIDEHYHQLAASWAFHRYE